MIDRVKGLRARLGAASRWPRWAEAQLDRHDERLDALGSELDVQRAALSGQNDEFVRLHDHVVGLTDVVDANNVWAQIERGTAWAASAPLEASPRISVVMPTRNRAHLLRGAVQSVQAQSYANWELLVTNDGSTDDTAEVLAEIATSDDRVQVLTAMGNGAAAARNAALDAASGSIMTFLDDDNTMTPQWLRAVAEFMSRVTDCEAMYGAQLRLSSNPADHGVDVLFTSRFDLAASIVDNSIDLGVIAVRAGHPQLRFDADLAALQDWELFTRIAATSTVWPVPVLASCYTSTSEGRITDRHGGDAAVVAMRERLRNTVAELQSDRQSG